MLISVNRNVLNCVILLLSMMMLCSVKCWLWILPSTQTLMTRMDQRSTVTVLFQNKAWMISGPGDNSKNHVYSLLWQICVWMWLLEVDIEMFTFQMKQFLKYWWKQLLFIDTVLLTRDSQRLSLRHVKVCKAFSSNVLGFVCLKMKDYRFIHISTVLRRISLLLFLWKVLLHFQCAV